MGWAVSRPQAPSDRAGIVHSPTPRRSLDRAARSLAAASARMACHRPRSCVTRDDPLLARDAAAPRAAAAGVACPRWSRDPRRGLRGWPAAPVVLVGADCAAALAALQPAAAARVHVRRPGAGRRRAVPRRRSASAPRRGELPASETWLVELLTDVGDGGGAPGATIGVIGGSGGAGATTFACALGADRGRRATGGARRRRPARRRASTGCSASRTRRRRPLGRPASAPPGGSSSRSLREALPAPRRARRAHLAAGPTAAAAGVRGARGALGRPRAATTSWWSTCRGSRDAVVEEMVARCDHVRAGRARSTVPGGRGRGRVVRAAAEFTDRLRPGRPRRPARRRARVVSRLLGLPLLAAMADQRGLDEAIDLGAGTGALPPRPAGPGGRAVLRAGCAGRAVAA